MITLNKKIMKIFIIFIILFNIFTNSSFALVRQSQEFFVNDTSNVLNEDTKKYIIDINKNLESQTGAQIVVVTVKSLEGKSIEDYSIELARKYRNRW